MQTRDFISVYDAVRVNLVALHNEPNRGEIFSGSTGIWTSVNKVIETMAGIAGCTIFCWNCRGQNIRRSVGNPHYAAGVPCFQSSWKWEEGMAIVLQTSNTTQGCAGAREPK